MAHKNVLMIIADDWSPIARCFGDQVVQTPNIDGVADQGTVFTKAFCTTPSCAASRASILTGHHSHRHLQFGHCHGIHHFRTKEDMPTLPSVLKDAGVHCELIGKNHTAPAQTYPWAKAHWPEVTPEGFRGAVAQALNRDKPCFLMVAPSYPHRAGKGEAARGFGLADKPEAFDDVQYDPDDLPVPGFLPDLPSTREDLSAYYTAISRYDQCVGGALRGLEDAGKADDTLVMILSDHGMPFPGAKASCYDTGHNCPLIIRRPGQQAAVRSEALLNWLDLAPTVYEYLGVQPPQEPALPGRSLLPVLEQEQPDDWDFTTFSHQFHEVTMYDPYRALRGRRYKYVQLLAHQMPLPFPSDLWNSRTGNGARLAGVSRWGQRDWSQYVHRAPEALYDLETDPLETTNRIDDPALAQVLDKMRRQLIDIRYATGDPWLLVDYQRGNPLVTDRPKIPT